MKSLAARIRCAWLTWFANPERSQERAITPLQQLILDTGATDSLDILGTTEAEFAAAIADLQERGMLQKEVSPKAQCHTSQK
jgi:hypothetical protein